MALRHHVLSIRAGETYTLVADGAALAMEGGEVLFDVVPAPALSPGSITATPGDGQNVITEATAPSGGTGSYTRSLEHSADGETGWAEIATALPDTHTGRTNGVTDYYRLEVSDGVGTEYTGV